MRQLSIPLMIGGIEEKCHQSKPKYWNDWENWMINSVKGRIKNLKEYQSTDLVASIFLSTTITFPPTTLTKLSGVSSVPNGANFVNAFLFQFCFVRNPFMSSWNYFNIKHKCTTTHSFNFIDHTLTKSLYNVEWNYFLWHMSMTPNAQYTNVMFGCPRFIYLYLFIYLL